MLFEWDDRKAAQNLAKHGVPFDYAARIFLDARRLILGKIEGRLFAVAYTPRGTVIRMISARKASQREERKYRETLST